MNNTQYIPFYKTKDRYIIYILLSTGCRVDGYEFNGRSIYFRFEDKEKCEKILSQFLSRKLKIWAHDFVDAIRNAQTIFYSNK